MNKKYFILAPLVAMALTSCGTTKLDATVANQKVVAAMEKMTDEPMNSLELKLAGSLGMSVITEITNPAYDMESGSTHVNAEATADLKAKDLDNENFMMSLIGSFNVQVEHPEESLVESADAEAEFYIADDVENNKWLYAKLSGDIGQIVGNPSVSQLKGKVPFDASAMIEDLLGVDFDPTLTEEFADLTEFIEIALGNIDQVTATSKDGNIEVNYRLTQEAVVNIILDFALEMTASEDWPNSQEYEETYTMLNDALTINKADITIGVDKLGYPNLLDIDLDIEIESPFYIYVIAGDGMREEQIGSTKTLIDFDVKLDLNVNKTLEITLPDDLDSYYFAM